MEKTLLDPTYDFVVGAWIVVMKLYSVTRFVAS
jgi:hypothetical protein